jgi:hypothetical protein
MALTKSILKMTETETVVKVAGAGGDTTISLDVDLLDVNQVFVAATSSELITLQESYDDALQNLADVFDSYSSDPNYPFGATLPVSHLTYSQLIVNAPGIVPTPLLPAALNVQHIRSDLLEAIGANVTITGVRWNGELGNTIKISRNSVRVLTLPTESADYIAFDGQEMPPEKTESDYDIVVEQTGTGQIELYLKLRKVSGYAPKVETAEFSVYDDTNTVGS